MIAHGLLIPQKQQQQKSFNPPRNAIPPCAIKASQSISFSSVPSLRSVSLSSSISSNQDTLQPASSSPSSSSSLSRESQLKPPPPPPWTFDVKRIYYEFRAIPIDQARKYCPPIQQQQQQQQQQQENQNDDGDKDDLSRPTLQILSFGGYTLGGIFCVEYQSSPVGPYNEVAILSSLLMDDILQFIQNLIQQQQQQRTTPILPQIGAWASHIFVDSNDAAYWGQQYWGLPATTLTSIQFGIDSNIGNKDNREDPKIVFDFQKNSIIVSDWDSTMDKSTPQSPLSSEEKNQSLQASSLAGGSATSTKPKWRISLPSFSGLLPLNNTTTSSSSSSPSSSSRTPLLQYPLSIMFGPSSANSDSNSSRIAWVPGKKLDFRVVNATTATTTTTQRTITSGENEEERRLITQEELVELFHNSFTLGSMQVDNIQLEAGTANVRETKNTTVQQ